MDSRKFTPLKVSGYTVIAICCIVGVYGTSVVSNNTSNAVEGGLLLDALSIIYSAASGRMIFQNNRAGTYGGAIYSFSKPFGFRLLIFIIAP